MQSINIFCTILPYVISYSYTLQFQGLPEHNEGTDWPSNAHLVLQEAVTNLSASMACSMDEDGCVERVKLLMVPMRKFVTAVRLEEGFLSRVQITGEVAHLSQHNQWEHELAMGRHAMATSSHRIRRIRYFLNKRDKR